jgi:hypothetical protein
MFLIIFLYVCILGIVYRFVQGREKLDVELKEAVKKFKTDTKPCGKAMVRWLQYHCT